MADIDGMNPELAITYFKRVAYPNGVETYQVEHVSETKDESDELLLVDLLMKCINELQIPIPQVIS